MCRASRSSGNDRPSWHLTGRLVTLADLNGRLEGVKQLVVPRGAVLTPAVRDRLRNIEDCGQLSGGTTSNTTRASGTLVLGVAETTCEPAALVAALRREESRSSSSPAAGWPA